MLSQSVYLPIGVTLLKRTLALSGQIVCRSGLTILVDGIEMGQARKRDMLLIRGDTRVADIYLTEFDRIFRHFYSRDVTNEIAKHHQQPEVGLLDDKFTSSADYFKSDNPKCHRRTIFFADPKKSWSDSAGRDADAFVGEGSRTRNTQPKANGKAKKAVKKAPKKAVKKAKKSPKKKKTKAQESRSICALDRNLMNRMIDHLRSEMHSRFLFYDGRRR
jgi:hypothetical protein